MKDVIHVLPVNDLINHFESGTWCWCQPRIEIEENGIVVVHNSADKRELREIADMKGRH